MINGPCRALQQLSSGCWENTQLLFLSTALLMCWPLHPDAGHAAVQVARFPKANGSRARTVVITQGKDPTVIAFNGKVRRLCRYTGLLALRDCFTAS